MLDPFYYSSYIYACLHTYTQTHMHPYRKIRTHTHNIPQHTKGHYLMAIQVCSLSTPVNRVSLLSCFSETTLSACSWSTTGIHNFRDWCCHMCVCTCCSSVIQRYIIVPVYLGSQSTKFQTAGWTY
jgi:hypothetical protein